MAKGKAKAKMFATYRLKIRSLDLKEAGAVSIGVESNGLPKLVIAKFEGQVKVAKAAKPIVLTNSKQKIMPE